MLSLLTYRAVLCLSAIAPQVTPRALVDDISMQLITDSATDVVTLERAVNISSRDSCILRSCTQPKKSGVVATSALGKKLFKRSAQRLGLPHRAWMRN